MSTLGVGFERTGSAWRVALAERRRGRIDVLAIAHPAGDGDDPATALRARLAARAHRALGAIPLAATTHRLLALPFTDEQTLARVVPLELRGQLPSDADDARIGFEVVRREGRSTHVLALLVRWRDLDGVAAAAAMAGVSLAGVTPGPLALRWLLPPGFTGTVLLADGRDTTVTLWDAGAPRALRALTASAHHPAAIAEELAWSLSGLGGAPEPFVVVGPDASPDLVEGCRRHHPSAGPLSLAHLPLDGDAASVLASPVACGLALGALEPRAHGPFALAAAVPRLVTPRLRRLAAAAAVLAVFDLGVVRFDLTRREARVRAALRSEAARALPDEPIVAPRAQLEAAASTRRAVGSAAYGTTLTRLREVSERIPDGLVVDVTRLTLEGERLQLVGNAPTFETVDVLRRALVGSARLTDVATDEVRTTVDGKRVSFRLRARWVAHGEASS
jgi:hypothetical protein